MSKKDSPRADQRQLPLDFTRGEHRDMLLHSPLPSVHGITDDRVAHMLLAIDQYAWGKATFVTEKTLMEVCRMTSGTARRAFKALRELGLIAVDRRPMGPGRKGTANHISIVWSELAVLHSSRKTARPTAQNSPTNRAKQPDQPRNLEETKMPNAATDNDLRENAQQEPLEPFKNLPTTWEEVEEILKDLGMDTAHKLVGMLQIDKRTIAYVVDALEEARIPANERQINELPKALHHRLKTGRWPFPAVTLADLKAKSTSKNRKGERQYKRRRTMDIIAANRNRPDAEVAALLAAEGLTWDDGDP